jgi:hypothetical protein
MIRVLITGSRDWDCPEIAKRTVAWLVKQIMSE